MSHLKVSPYPYPMREDYGEKLDKLNPDLTLDIERAVHFVLAGGSGNIMHQMHRLKALLVRQTRYGKSLGYEGAMEQIREGVRDR